MICTQSDFYGNYFLYGFGHGLLLDSVIHVLFPASGLVKEILSKCIQIKMSKIMAKLRFRATKMLSHP